MKPIVQYWRQLNITAKFSTSFAVLLACILLVSIISYISLRLVHSEMEAAILTGTEIQGLVLEMDRGLQDARVLQRDFFWRYPHIGFTEAYQTYALEAVQKMANVVTLSAELRDRISNSDVSLALRKNNVNLNFYLSAAERYADTFSESVELVTHMAAPETGLEAQLAQNSALLQELLEMGDSELITAYQEMTIFEHRYYLTRQRPYMQSAFNIARQLGQAIDETSSLTAEQKEQALNYLDTYHTIGTDIVNLNVDIRSKLQDFDLQAEAVNPISTELIALSKAEVKRSQLRIEQINQLATIILVAITLGGLLLVWLVANLLNESITQNIIKLTEVTTQWQAGNLNLSAEIESVDEIGQLAVSFNEMATRINMLVNNLEQTVQARTRRLETVADVGRQLNTILEFDKLLMTLVNQVTERFKYYHVHIYMLDQAKQNLIMQAGVGQVGASMKQTNYQISLDSETSLVARAARSGKIVMVDDVRAEADWFTNPLLPNTQSEIAVPIVDGEILGVLDVQSDRVAGLDEGDANLLRSLANQVAIAITNARLFEQVGQANHKLASQNIELEAQANELAQQAERLKKAMKMAETARKEAELAREAAQNANQAKSDFLSKMSHELRTPLNGILGYTQILKRDQQLTTKQQEGLTIIESSSNHLLTLINDILDLSKIEAHKMELYPTTTNINDFMDSVVGIMRMKAQQKGLDFVTEIADLSHSLLVDEKRLRQVLLNLLSNAIKFTASGQVTVRLLRLGNIVPLTDPTIVSNSTTLTSPAEQQIFRFEVEDTGTGMTFEQTKKIFEAFEQVGDVEKRVEGTGLGLAITKQLVELMGGNLQVKSEFNKGTLFWFEITLPVVKISLDRLALANHQTIIGYQGKPRAILVVDDIFSNRAVLRGLLEPLGFEIFEAEDGAKGIELAQHHQFDLILTDLVMPTLDGLGLIKQIQTDPKLKDTPIIILSASSFDTQQWGEATERSQGFLTKPFSVNDLLDLIATCLKLTWEYEQTTDVISEANPQKISLIKYLQNCSPEFFREVEKAAHDGDLKKLITLAELMTQQDAIAGNYLITLIERVDHEFLLQFINEVKIAIPSVEALSELRWFAERGSMKRVRKWCDQLIEKDQQYRSFVEQVELLAKQYDSESIVVLTTRYLE